MGVTAVQSPAAPIGVPPKLKPKIGRNFLSCATLAVVFFALAVSLVAYLISETGLASVPLFSRWYEGPRPTRNVTVAVVNGQLMQARIVASLQKQVAKDPVGPYSVRLDEADLSGVLTSAIAEATKDQDGKPQNIQLVVRPDGLELSGDFVRGFLHFRFLAFFVPVLEDGNLRFEIKSAQIGDFHFSPYTSLRIMDYMLARDIEGLKIGYGPKGLRNIRLHDGYIEIITGIPS